MQLDKKVISKQDIYNRISSIDIFKTYCPNFNVSTKISSPFRNDKNPSLGFFLGKSGELIFKDLATGDTGDCFDFVGRLFQLSYFDTLSKIATDFNFPTIDAYFYKDLSSIKTTGIIVDENERSEILNAKSATTSLNIKVRPWNNSDAKFWFHRGISYTILKTYKVQPISHIFINDKIILADEIAYAFTELKDGEITYKIYQPFNKVGLKWLSSHDSSVWQGWSQLPEKHHSLIITKSLKDVMAITNLMKIPSVALQSENTKPKANIIDELKSRFTTIYVLYDNDFDKEVNIGRELGHELTCAIGAIQIEIPTVYKSKDFTDLVLNVQNESAIKILDRELIPF